MDFKPTQFDEAFLITPHQHEDERGGFARTWCRREFAERGIDDLPVQCSTSFNRVAGTLRGMHFQATPHAEAKLVRCVRGAIFDVIVDVRESSETFGRWQGFELSDSSLRMLYIPRGFAHGFQTLRPNTEVLYQISEFYAPESSRTFHFADPELAIHWPLPVSMVSAKDSSSPRLRDLLHDSQLRSA